MVRARAGAQVQVPEGDPAIVVAAVIAVRPSGAIDDRPDRGPA